MPIFEFKCDNGHVTERITSSSVMNVACKLCTKMATKIISVPARAQFKGDGWTPNFHGPTQSQIGGVPVKKGDDPREIARRVVERNGGPKGLTKAVQEAK